MIRPFLKLSEFRGYDTIDRPTWGACIVDVENFHFARETCLKGGIPAVRLYFRHGEPIVVGETLDEFFDALARLVSIPNGGVHV